MASSDDLLKEIRDRFQYCVDSWRTIREEARKDMCYVAGDPWSSTTELRREKEARKEAGRPAVALDELNQYLNQIINNVRQNKRAIKVSPGDQGGDDSTAELHGDIIRTIEYTSNAQAAYITAFENALQRSYGYFRVGKRYIAQDSFLQELYIGRIPDPDTVLIDPDCKEADCSDMQYCFVIQEYKREDFERKWPRAQVKDFPSEYISNYPLWVREKTIQVAEYWKLEKKSTELLMVETQAGAAPVYADDLKDLPAGIPVNVTKRRKTERIQVVQYITNGLEILERNEWDGRWIPIIPVFGKEIYVDLGSGPTRVLLSLVRLARDSQMLYNYLKSGEMELVGMTPKTPWVGYEGQFEGHETEWANANRVPISYLQVRPVLDATGQAVLPLPQRQVYEPPIQALELLSESSKRGIQNALGMYNASVGRQDTAAKSGIAIRALDLQSDQGNYHYIDNYDRALEHAGRILDEMIPKVYDTARMVAIRKPDDQMKSVLINQPHQDPKTGEVINNRVANVEHSVMISTGPSYQSQREEASAFADTLAGVPQILPLIGDLVVKLKNLGPVGDEMEKRLRPPQFAEDEKGPNPQMLMQQLQQSQAMIQSLTEALNKTQSVIDQKQIEQQGQAQLAQVKAQADAAIAREKAQVEAQLAQAKAELDMQVAERKAAADAAAAERKASMDAAVAEKKISADIAIAQAKIESEERIARMQAELELEKVRMQNDSRERSEVMRASHDAAKTGMQIASAEKVASQKKETQTESRG